MCYDTDARPPLPPISGGAPSSGEGIALTSADGTQFSAYFAKSVQPSTLGVVILPDVRGLFAFYEELALRFADAGVNAVAIDYFGRTAGLLPRSASFEFMPHVLQTDPSKVAEDVAAAVGLLRDSLTCQSIFTLGFCFGGRASFNQAGKGHGLAGVVGFYGRVGAASADDEQAPINLAPTYDCKVLGLFGGADPSIPIGDIELFDKTLESLGVEHEIKVYEGAPHSFFDRSFEEFKDECDDAWRRVLSFING